MTEAHDVLKLLPPVTTSPEDQLEALAHLRRLNARGKLRPIDGWDGDLVEGYADMLGVNGRPLRNSFRPSRSTRARPEAEALQSVP